MKQKLTPYVSQLGALALAFGYAVGWGSFVMPGASFLPGAGPLGTFIGVVLGALAMLVFAHNYHQLSIHHPGPGGVFTYAKKSFGDDHGFLTGWALCIAYIAILWANSTALMLLSRFMFGDALQFGFHYEVGGFHVYGGEVLFSELAIVVCAALCMFGKKLAVRVQILMVTLLFGGAALCFAGAVRAHEGGFATMAPAWYHGGYNCVGEVLKILSMMPWAFVGFEAITHSSGEFKFNVNRTFRILAWAVGISAAVYIMLAVLPAMLVPGGFSNWQEYIRALPGLSGDVSMPVIAAAQIALGTFWGKAVVGVAMFAALITGIIATLVATSRLLYAMAEDGVFPDTFCRLNKGGSPYAAIAFVAGVSMIVPFFGRTPITWPVDVSSIGAAVAYGYTSAAAIAVARPEDGMFSVLRARVLGVAGISMSIFFCILLMVPNYVSASSIAAESYLLLAMWCILGMLFYRRIFAHDENGRFGKTLVVWVSFAVMVMFASLMWVRQATFNSTLYVIESIVDTLEEQQELVRSMDDLGKYTLGNSLIQMGLLVTMLTILISLFAILRKREQNMAAEKAKTEELHKTMRYFFSTVSHDIRTPLNAIIGFSEMLRLGIESESEKRQAIDSICLSGKALLDLINDVLDLSKLEAGKMHIIPEPVPCKLLIEEVVDTFAKSNKKPDLNIRARVDDMPVLMMDPKRLRQIIFNLVGNAVKYTKAGYVEVRASYEGCTFRLEVSDTGCGISEEDLLKIATPYVQIETQGSRHGGTGLGLAITQQLAQSMGGRLDMASKLGTGSTFSVVVPGVKEASPDQQRTFGGAAGANAAEAPAEPAADKPRRRALLVDDQKMNLIVLEKLMDKLGNFEFETAANGKEALAKLERPGAPRFDIVLTDMWMPDMNGESLVKAIRANPAISSLDVYVITADIETQAEYKQHGFTGMVLKPVTLAKLKEVVG